MPEIDTAPGVVILRICHGRPFAEISTLCPVASNAVSAVIMRVPEDNLMTPSHSKRTGPPMASAFRKASSEHSVTMFVAAHD